LFFPKQVPSPSTGLNRQGLVLIISETFLKEMTHERTGFDHRIRGNLSAVADLCAAENGNFHLNAQCLSGDRQEKYRQ
jgi:hypothetical protein